MNFIKRNKAYFIGPAIVLLILSVIFAVKGVYPFGGSTVSYYDMPLNYIPLYTHTYDILHGSSPALLDWNNAASCDFTYNFGNYLINPFNLLLFFTKRDKIIYFMSIILMIKLALSSFTMTLYIKKKHRANDLNTVILSLMYSFCGFALSDYINIFFLDMLVLFPLLMLSLEHMIKARKPLPYAVLSFITIVINGYLIAMAYIYIILFVFGYFLFIEKNNDNRRRIISDLGIYTFIAVIMALGIGLPTLIKTAHSPRTEYIITFDEILSTRTGEFDEQKLFMLFGSEFAVAVLILTVIKCISNRQKPDPKLKFSLYCMILLTIPMISEASHLLLLFGSYAHFPYRFGYVLAFTSIDILAGFISEHNSEKPYFQIKKPKLARAAEYAAIAVSLTTVVVFSILAYMLKDLSLMDFFYSNNATIKTYRAVLTLMILSGLMIFGLCNRKMRYVLFASVVILQSVLGSFGFIAPQRTSAVEVNDLVDISTSVYGELDLERDNLSRLKTTSANTFFANFSLLSGYPGISDWTLNPSPEYMNEMSALGYHCPYTSCYGQGGTVFSDALLNIKMLYDPEKEDSNDLYTFKQEVSDLYFYDCNYTLPFGMLADGDLSALPESDGKSAFEVQNNIFRAFSDNEDLFTYYSLSDLDYEYSIGEITNILLPYNYKFDLDIKGNAVLYTFSSNEDLAYSCIINEDLAIDNESSEKTTNKKTGEVHNNKHFVDFGTFKDETVNLHFNISTDSSFMIKDLYIGILNLDKLREICDRYAVGDHAYDVKAEGTELTMKVDDPDGRWLFLPIEYNSKWKATINGSSAEVTPVMGGAFVGIKLGSEDADITLKYVPSFQYLSLIILFTGIMLLAVLVYMDKKGHRLSDVKVFSAIASVTFTAVAYGLLIYMFAAPVLGNIISLIISRTIL